VSAEDHIDFHDGLAIQLSSRHSDPGTQALDFPYIGLGALRESPRPSQEQRTPEYIGHK
jgi:hypothetical protein